MVLDKETFLKNILNKKDLIKLLDKEDLFLKMYLKKQ